MNIVIHLSNKLISEAICELLLSNGYVNVVRKNSRTNGFTPHVLLVDVTTLRQDLLDEYPNAKVLLIDTGMESEKLCATLLSYKIHGIISPHAELRMFKKAVTAVIEGQIWIDNGSVKALLHHNGTTSRTGKMSGITGREKEIIEYICRGSSNKEIAQKLNMSEHTVKTHLSAIFRKFDIKSRSKLLTLTMDGPFAGAPSVPVSQMKTGEV